ncbi:MAG: hypothetical protein ACRD72_04225 [Candidatus Angelobacter sp.]|jgi:hypothetical protein
MLPVFPADRFAQLVAATHDVARDKFLFDDQKYSNVARLLQDMEEHCKATGLVRSSRHIRAVLDACEGGKCPPIRFQSLVTPIPKLLIEELSEFVFLSIPRERVSLFKAPPGKGPKVPGAEDAVREFHTARRCLGLGEPTACVLHLARVLDFGAKVVAKSLGINTESLSLGQVAAEVQESVRKMAKSGLCNAETEEFYNALVTDIRAFARAYRNPAVHKLQTFDDATANSMIAVVGDLMRHLVKHFGDFNSPKPPQFALVASNP